MHNNQTKYWSGRIFGQTRSGSTTENLPTNKLSVSLVAGPFLRFTVLILGLQDWLLELLLLLALSTCACLCVRVLTCVHACAHVHALLFPSFLNLYGYRKETPRSRYGCVSAASTISCLASLISTPRQLCLERVLTLPLGYRQMELAEQEGNLTTC